MTRPHHLALALAAAVTLSLLALVSSEDVCEILQTAPRKNAPPLLFCSWYRSRSCCLPAFDADMGAKFQAFIEAGPTCEKYHNKAKLFLAMAFCYACDPDQPLTFTEPLNAAFFNASKTAKICRTVTDRMAPKKFSDCGLMLPDDRETSCSPNSAVVAELVWPDCTTGQYVCQDKQQNWYCNEDRCGAENTPQGFADVPCDEESRTCDGTLMLLNDNRAAKPPYFEDYVIEIVDEDLCMKQHANASRCRCMRPPIQSGAGSTSGRASIVVVALHVLWVLMCA